MKDFCKLLLVFWFQLGSLCGMEVEQPAAFQPDSWITDLLSHQVPPASTITPKEEPKFHALSVFMQQLTYHDRLLFKKIPCSAVHEIDKQVAAVTALAEKKVCQAKPTHQIILVGDDAMDGTTQLLFVSAVEALLTVATKKGSAAQRSGWVFKGEYGFYILHPLHLALKHNLIECAEILIKNGVDSNAQDHLGRGPLHVVSFLKDEDAQTKLAKLLCFKGGDLNGATKQGITPMASAVERKAHKLLDFLLDLGANPNSNVEAEAAGKKSLHAVGVSPLWLALSQRDIISVGLLLKRRAKLKAAEQVAAQLMHDNEQDQNYKVLLKKAL
ncbi:MAG: ankyrin repeat domain-containing protein [Candidatus Babeliales bacterium]